MPPCAKRSSTPKAAASASLSYLYVSATASSSHRGLTRTRLTRCWIRIAGRESGHLALAFTRYCHCQYCMVYGMYKGGRVGVVYCALVVQ